MMQKFSSRRFSSQCFVGFTVLLSCAFAFAPLTLTAAADLPTIQKRGRLIVAVKDNLPPLGFRDSQSRLQGLEIDLAQRLAQELLGKTDAVELRPVLNQERFEQVLSGNVDLAIAKATLTPSRLRILRFSLPYYTDGTALITNNPAIQKPLDLSRRRVAVLNGSSSIEAVRRRIPTADLVGVNSYSEAKTQLNNGTVIAIAADATTLTGWLSESPGYRLILPNLSSELLCIVLPKGQQYENLRRQIDLILSRLRSNGWLEERAKYWGLPVE